MTTAPTAPARVRRGLAPRSPGLLVAAAVLAIAGCSSASSPDDDGTGPPVIEVGDPMPVVSEGKWSEACPTIERPAVQQAFHLSGDETADDPYTSVPATSGPHSVVVPAAGEVYEGLGDPEIVSAIEAGIVVVAVEPGTDLTGVEEITTQFPSRVLVTTYDGAMPTPVALVTWGAVARCDVMTPWDITSFVLTERVTSAIDGLH